MKSLTAPELAQWLQDAARPQPLMLDVREPWEYDICHIEGAELVATVRLRERVESLDPDQPVVCICHHGVRSMHVARFLTEHGFSQAHNLSGGIDAWARQVDRSMPTY